MRRALLIALALAFPGSAHASSLVYTRDGDVFRSAPDGGNVTRVTTGGGYAWPSQADDGTILTVRDKLLYRFRDGAPLGEPVETVPKSNSWFIGPLAPEISPDGTMVAYHYFNTGVLSDRSVPSVAYSRTDAGTQPGVFGGHLGGYLSPSWTADGHVLVFFASQRTAQVGIDTIGGDYRDWFGDPAVETLLTNGELSRAGDRLVAIGDQNDLRFYDGGANLRCVMTGFNGAVGDPTWSPAGDALAWEEADGIHVAALPDLGACGSVARPLVIAGGKDPDWGPADIAAPAPVVVDPPTTPARLRLTVAVTRRGRALKVTPRCSLACTTTATLKLGKRNLARARGKGTLTLRYKRRGKATLTVTATAGTQRATVVKRVRL